MKGQWRSQFLVKLRVSRRAGQQLIHPNPGHTAEGDLQRTTPVDPERVWVGFDPASELGDYFADIFFIVAEQPGLGQRDQVLVAIEFPSDLVVAHDREIEKGNLEPGIERRSLSVDSIQMPVDLGAIVEIFIAQ